MTLRSAFTFCWFSSGEEFNKTLNQPLLYPCVTVLQHAPGETTESLLLFWHRLLHTQPTISMSRAPSLTHGIPYPKPAKMQGSFSHNIAAHTAALSYQGVLEPAETHITWCSSGKDVNWCITRLSWYCTRSATPTRLSDTAASFVATAKQLLKHTQTHTHKHAHTDTHSLTQKVILPWIFGMHLPRETLAKD